MSDWKRILINSVDQAHIPQQIVDARVIAEVGAMGNESFHLVLIKAGQLVDLERPWPSEVDEYCLLSWEGDEVEAMYRGSVLDACPPEYAAAQFDRIKTFRASGRCNQFHPSNPMTAH